MGVIGSTGAAGTARSGGRGPTRALRELIEAASGAYFRTVGAALRLIDRALWAVITTGHVTATSTRKVDDLVNALGCDSGVSKSTVSRICTGIDADAAVLRT